MVVHKLSKVIGWTGERQAHHWPQKTSAIHYNLGRTQGLFPILINY